MSHIFVETILHLHNNLIHLFFYNMKKLKITIMLLIAVSLLGEKTFSQSKAKTYKLGGYDIEVEGNLNGFSMVWQTEEIEEGLEIATISLKHPQGEIPPQFSLKWAIPSKNVAGFWSSRAFLDKTISANLSPNSL